MEQIYYGICRVLGRLLKGARYTRVRRDRLGGRSVIVKRRLFHAGLLVRLGEPLMLVLDTGVRVLREADWVRREQEVFARIHGELVERAPGGGVILPRLPGEDLADFLARPELDTATRRRALAAATAALQALHEAGESHGDATLENFLFEPSTGTARLLDFETSHEEARSWTWRRADDVRALLMTAAAVLPEGELAEAVELVRTAYGDPGVWAGVQRCMRRVMRRTLLFHLAQSGLGYAKNQLLVRLLGS